MSSVSCRDGEGGAWQDWQNSTPGTAAVFKGQANHTYYFRCRATNYAGLRSEYSDAAQAFTQVNPVLDSTFTAYSLSPASPVTATTSPQPSTTITATTSPQPSTTVTNTAAITGTAAISSTTTAAIPPLPSDTTPAASPSSTVTSTSTISATATADITATVSLLPPRSSKAVVFPLMVKNGDANSGTSGIIIENPNSAALDVFVRFSDHNGAPITTTVNGVNTKTSPDQAAQISRVATLLVSVPPKSNKSVWVGNLGVNAYNGWVSIMGSDNFVATAVRLPKSGQALTYTPSVAANTLYLPYLKKAGTGDTSFINLANPNAAPANVQITYYDASSGQIVNTKTLQVPMLGSVRLSTATLITSTSNQATPATEEHLSGAAIISASVPIAANVELPQADGSQLTYAALTQLNPTAQTVFYRNANGFSSLLAVQNTGKNPASFKVTFTDTNGQTVATTDNISVPSYGRADVGQAILGDVSQFQGIARVISSDPMAVIAVGGPASLQNSSQLFP